MSNESLFTGRAGNYSAARPGYAPAAVELIFRELISPGQTAVDVGSGTGILSGEFLRRGYDVYCVEPNADMRSKAEALLGKYAGFHSLSASAEHTGLPNGCAQLVTAASAFHWFDAASFRTECTRILTPGGAVCVLINVRDYNDELTLAQHKLCTQYCPGYTSLRHGLEETEPELAAFFSKEFHRAEFSFPLRYTTESFVRRSLSSSYSPAPGTPEYDPFVCELRALAGKYAPDGDLTVPNSTVIFWGAVN